MRKHVTRLSARSDGTDGSVAPTSGSNAGTERSVTSSVPCDNPPAQRDPIQCPRCDLPTPAASSQSGTLPAPARSASAGGNHSGRTVHPRAIRVSLPGTPCSGQDSCCHHAGAPRTTMRMTRRRKDLRNSNSVRFIELSLLEPHPDSIPILPDPGAPLPPRHGTVDRLAKAVTYDSGARRSPNGLGAGFLQRYAPPHRVWHKVIPHPSPLLTPQPQKATPS